MKQYPRQMLRARVISEGIRTIFPGCIGSFYTPEEAQDFDVKPVVRDVAPQAVTETSPAADTDSLIKTLQEAGDLETLRELWERIQPAFKQLDPASQQKVKDAKSKLKAALRLPVEITETFEL